MQHLFDSDGLHIANFGNGTLYAPNGRAIGLYLSDKRIFIDLEGRYLGEIVRTDRLMSNRSSGYKATTFSVNKTPGNTGSYGNPGNESAIGSITGFEDIPDSRLHP